MKRELIRHVIRTAVWEESSKGYVSLDVSLVIDLDRLAHDMGQKAFGSKHGRSIGMHGAVVAHITKRSAS